MSTDHEKLEALTDGVFAWMADRPISTHDALEDGARKGVIERLDANRGEIIEAIAGRVANGLTQPEEMTR